MRTTIYCFTCICFLLLGLCITLTAQAASPTLRFEQLSIEHGLSQNTVTSILQDSRGYLWLGTRDGLNRYDGYEFKVFRNDPQITGSISDNHIWSIFEDNNNTLWIGTSQGLNRYDHQRQSFSYFRHEASQNNSLSDDGVRTIYQDSSDTLWIGTNAGGLNRFDSKTQTFVAMRHQPTDPHSLSHNRVYSIVEDSKGNLWIGTGKGLNRLSKKRPDKNQYHFDRFVHQPGKPGSLSHNRVRSVFEDSRGILWVATQKGGLNRYHPDSQTFDHFKHQQNNPNSISSNLVIAIKENSDGKLWLGTWGGGLNIFDPLTDQFVTIRQSGIHANSISSNLIYSLYQDKKGLFWVGTSGGGVNHFDGQTLRFSHFKHDATDPGSLSESNVRSILKDSKGTLWVGTRGSGLNRYNSQSGQFESFKHDKNKPNSLSAGQVYALFEDSTGALWLGTSTGLSQYHPATQNFSHFKHQPSDPNSLSSNRIKAIAEDADGALWIATASGLNRLNRQTGQFKTFKHQPNNPNSLSNDLLTSVTVDSDNTLWVGTLGGGLNHYDPKSASFVHYRHQRDNANSLSHDRVFAIHQDKKGTLWIGTPAGLNRFDAKTAQFNHYREKDGLASDAVLGILEDGNGFLWLSGNKGLSKFASDTAHFSSFDARDGLQSNEFNVTAAYQSADGELFFGGINGFNRFYGESIISDPHPPKVDFTNFLLSNQSVPIRKQSILNQSADNRFTLDKTISALDEVTLTHKQNLVSLQFSALDFASPMKNRYAYQLEGWDDHWIYADAKQRQASYTKLHPGNYVFKVKASNKDGHWSEQPTAIKIHVLPPWWKTWQAYLLYVTVLFGSIYAFYRYRTQALVARANELEDKVTQRTATINRLMSQKQQMFTNVSHEFKTPLTLILNPLASLPEHYSSPEFDAKVSMMQRNGQRLLHMVEQLLELSKLETGATEQRHHYSLAETLNRLITSFQPLLDNKNLTLKRQPFIDVLVFLTTDALEMIINNLLSNAIKYTPTDGQISINVNARPSDVVITIADNGIGISPENQQIVFNRFTRASEEHNENIPGAGIGLALVKDLVETNQGSITLNSQVNGGSVFTVTLPLAESQDAATQNVSGLSTTSLIEINHTTAKANTSASESEKTPLQRDQNGHDITSSVTNTLKPNLLLIDDNPDMLQLLTNVLAEKYHCVTANNGEQGVAIAKEQVPDLVLSDVMMPGISGFEVLSQLKLDELTNHIPVILLTARGDIQSRLRGWAEKADEYLEKPFNNQELLLRIDNLLSIRTLLRQRYQRTLTAEVESSTTVESSTAVDDTQTIADTPEQDSSINSVSQKFFDKLNGVLETHYADEDLDIALVASEMAMSQRQMSRKIRSLLDLTPTEYVRNFRLKKAIVLLAEGMLPSVVAYQVGFTSHSYFGRCFKAQYDCLPSSYKGKEGDAHLT